MDIIPAVVLFVALLISTIIDIRTREVPDLLSFSLVCFGIFYAIAKSLIMLSWMPFLIMLVGLAAGLLVAVLMYYTGQWGGGDSMLIMGVGSVIGLWFEHPDFLTFLVNLLIGGAVYGIFWSIGLAIKHRKTFFSALHAYTSTPRMLRIRVSVLILVIILLACAFLLLHDTARLILIACTAVLYVLYILLIFTRLIERTIMIVALPVRKLTEGDWLAEEILVQGKRIGKTGVTKQQIALLKKKRKTVLVKIGIPFVPSFLIALLAYLALGNWLVLW
ncbi:MAG: A24 family peptidase [archaeon]